MAADHQGLLTVKGDDYHTGVCYLAYHRLETHTSNKNQHPGPTTLMRSKGGNENLLLETENGEIDADVTLDPNSCFQQ